MIYTCTTNPSLDYYLTIEEVKLGVNNRVDMEMYEAGGKGVNVSIMLNNFNIKSSCLGFLGGFTKDYYLSFINNYPNIQPLFTTIKDNTRINIKLMDNNYETGFNANGPKISDEEFNKFKSRLLNIYENDIFVLSGSIEDEIEDKLAEVVHELAGDGVQIVLDTEPSVLNRCADIKPLLVKLNDTYSEYVGKDIIDIGKQWISNGAKYVMYSAPKKDSYLFSENEILKCKNFEDGLVNTTGSADSMVAGFLYAYLRGGNAEESFKYANAACMATTLTNDLSSKAKLEELFNTIEVDRL